MRKPITVAMLISVVMHVALFLIADWLIGNRAAARPARPLPVISIEALQAEFRIPSAVRLDEPKAVKIAGRSERSAGRQKTTLTATRHASARPSKRAITSSKRLPAVGLEHASTRISAVSALMDAAVSKPDVVTSNVSGETIVMSGISRNEPPSFATAAVSRRQERMLRRKLTEFSETVHRVSDATQTLSWRHQNQAYSADFTHEPASDDMDIERMTVIVSTQQHGQRLSTEIRMKRLAFSNYAQFINRWDSDVHIHDDELDGRFHSNTQINLSYSRKVKPRFYGQVTTSARRVNVIESRGYVPRDQIFLGGLQTGVRAIRLPEHFLPFPGKTADDNVHRFDGDARITFHADGGYDWQSIDPASSWHRVADPGERYFLVGGKRVELRVKGTVNGQVLIYSPERIVIEGNLVYAEDPRSVPGAGDFLGLASDKYVDIARPDITGPGDLVINAAIYAKRRFAVRGYRFRDTSLLHIFGSLTAGTLSATEPRYATKIEFDRRLEQMRPPRFPMTNRYAVESWDLSWTIEPAGTGH